MTPQLIRALIVMLAGFGALGAMLAAGAYEYFRLATSDMPDSRAGRRLMPWHVWLASFGYNLICVSRIAQTISAFDEPIDAFIIVGAIGIALFDVALIFIMVHTRARSEASSRQRIDITLGKKKR